MTVENLYLLYGFYLCTLVSLLPLPTKKRNNMLYGTNKSEPITIVLHSCMQNWKLSVNKDMLFNNIVVATVAG